jgi:peptide/nickel transport system substrate-binding protein
MAQHNHVVISHVVSRRRFLVLLGLGSSAALATACQPAPSAPTTTVPLAPPAPAPTAARPASEPAAKAPAAKAAAEASNDTINFAAGVEWITLDPADVNSSHVQQLYIFDYLTSLAPDMTVRPGLATDWTTSPDGLKWTFRLRRGVQFHDGQPLDANAVKFTIDRLLDEKKARKGRQYLTPGSIKSVHVVDESTVEMTLGQPFGPLPSLLATTPGIVSPKAAQELGDDFGRRPVGSGPFKFQEWVSGQRMVFARNENYWGTPAKPQKLVFLIVPEAVTRAAMVETGEADIAQHVPPSELKRLRSNPRIKPVEADAFELRQLRLIMLKEVYKDVRVRQAMNYAVNVPEIIDTVLEGAGTFTGAPLPKSLPGALQTSKYRYDPALAKKLLAEAGYANGLKASVIASRGVSAGTDEVLAAVQAQFRAVGIDMTISVMDQSAVGANRALPPAEAEAKHMVFHGLSAVYPDPHAALYNYYHSSAWSPKGSNHGFYKNARVDELLEQGGGETVPAKRTAIYREIQEILLEDASSVILYTTRYLYAARSNLKDAVLLPTEVLPFPDMSKT